MSIPPSFKPQWALIIKSAILLEWMHLFVPHGTPNRILVDLPGYNVGEHIILYLDSYRIRTIMLFHTRICGNPKMPGKCFNSKVLFVSNTTLNLFRTASSS